MDVRRYWDDIRDSISNRISFLASDLRFIWVVKDKTGLYLALVAIGMLAGVWLFTSFMLKYNEDSKQIRCLALNIYHEARGEPKAGQYAVAEVTMNRVRSKHYPDTVCSVVYQKNWDQLRKRYVGMFSWTELDEPPRLKSKFWRQSFKIAEKVYNDDYVPMKKLKGSLFYHARHIRPSWTKHKKPLARIGNHIFY
jgi:N-acetylmuramoyl-L-alanine amidase